MKLQNASTSSGHISERNISGSWFKLSCSPFAVAIPNEIQGADSSGENRTFLRPSDKNLAFLVEEKGWGMGGTTALGHYAAWPLQLGIKSRIMPEYLHEFLKLFGTFYNKYNQ
jgi:hypothetical protein